MGRHTLQPIRRIVPLAVLVLAVATAVRGAEGKWGPSTGTYLYTAPDASARGGIRGRVVAPLKPLVAVFALPPDNPKLVYRARLEDTNGHTFEFTGLPAGRYDLIIAFDDAFYEGITLLRGEDTLTSTDRKRIEDMIAKTEKFYNHKTIHRVEGTTGSMKGKARCLTTFLRTKWSVDYDWTGGRKEGDRGVHLEHRRAIKLVLLEDVGPGFQVTKTREIHTTMIKPGTGVAKHAFRAYLGRIRVVDSVKDLGDLDLMTVGSRRR